MARDRVQIEEWERYVPDIDNERKLFEVSPNEALSAEVRHLSRSDREAYQRVFERGRSEMAIKADKDRSTAELRRMLSENVRGIVNYRFNGRDIITGADLFDCDEYDIVVDFTAAILNRGHLDRGLAKKLGSPSATSSPRPKSSAGGDAHSATKALHLDNEATPTLKIQNSGSMTSTSDGPEIVMASSGHPSL